MIQEQIINALQQISFKPKEACFHLNRLFDTSDLFMPHLILVARAPDTKSEIRSQALLTFNNYLIKSITKYQNQKPTNGPSHSHQYYTRIGQYNQLLRSVFFDQQHLKSYAYKKIIIPSHIKFVSHFQKCSIGSNHLWQLLKDLMEKELVKQIEFDCITVFLQIALSSKIDYDQILKMIKKCYPSYFTQTLLYMQDFEKQLIKIQNRFQCQRNQANLISNIELQNIKIHFDQRIKPINVSLIVIRQILTQFDSSKEIIKKIRNQDRNSSNQKHILSKKRSEMQMVKLQEKIKKEHEKNKQLKNKTFNEILHSQDFCRFVTGLLGDQLCVSKQNFGRLGRFYQQLQKMKSNVFMILISLMKKIDEKYRFQESKSPLLNLLPSLVAVIVNELMAYQKAKKQDNFLQIQDFKILVPVAQQIENQRIIACMFKFMIQATEKKELYKLFHEINAESTIYLTFPYLDVTRSQKINFLNNPEDFIAVLNYYSYPIEDEIDLNWQLKINVSQFLRKMKKVDGFTSFFYSACIQLLLSKFIIAQSSSQRTQQIQKMLKKDKVFSVCDSKRYSLVSGLWGLTILGIDEKNNEHQKFRSVFQTLPKNSIALLKQVLYLLVNHSKQLSQTQLSYLFNFIKYHGLIFEAKEVMLFAMYVFQVDQESQGLYSVVADFFFQTIQCLLRKHSNTFSRNRQKDSQNQEQIMVSSANRKRRRNYQNMQQETIKVNTQFTVSLQSLSQIFDKNFIQKFIKYTSESSQVVWLSKISEIIDFEDQDTTFFNNIENKNGNQGIIPSAEFCLCLMKKIDKELLKKYPQQHVIVLCLNILSKLIQRSKVQKYIQKQIFDWILNTNQENQLLSNKYQEQVSGIVLSIIMHDQQNFKIKETGQQFAIPQCSILSQGNKYQQIFGNKLLKTSIQNYRIMIKNMSNCKTRQRSSKLCKMRETFFKIICYSVDNSNYFSLVKIQGIQSPIQNTAFINNMKEVVRAITDNLTYYSLFAEQFKVLQQQETNAWRLHDRDYFIEFYQMIIFEAMILLNLVVLRRNEQFDTLRQKFDINKVTQIENTILNLSDPWNQIFCILSHCFIQNKQLSPILRPNCIIHLCLLYFWYSHFQPKHIYSVQVFHLTLFRQHDQEMKQQIFKYLVNNFTKYQFLSSTIQTIIGLKLTAQIKQIISLHAQTLEPIKTQVHCKLQFIKRLLTLTANVLLHLHQVPNKIKMEIQIDYKTKDLSDTLPVSINHSPFDQRKSNMYNNFRRQIKMLIELSNQLNRNFQHYIRQIVESCQVLVRQLFQIQSIPVEKGSQTRKIIKIKK